MQKLAKMAKFTADDYLIENTTATDIENVIKKELILVAKKVE